MSGCFLWGFVVIECIIEEFESCLLWGDVLECIVLGGLWVVIDLMFLLWGLVVWVFKGLIEVLVWIKIIFWGFLCLCFLVLGNLLWLCVFWGIGDLFWVFCIFFLVFFLIWCIFWGCISGFLFFVLIEEGMLVFNFG